MKWMMVAGWPYEVSEDGQVRNSRTGHTLKLRKHKSGYMVVQLWNQGEYLTTGCHQLVAAAFLGPRPGPEYEVGHRNGDAIDNHFKNLKWVKHEENMRDRDTHGTTARGDLNGKTRYSDALVAEAKAAVRAGERRAAVSRRLGIPPLTLAAYMDGSRRKHIP